MKIEKGKLYYNTTLGRLEKATHSYEIEKGLLTDKIAVHCPTREDWDYVVSKGYHLCDYKGDVYYTLYHKFYDTYYFLNHIRCHIIEIDQFKEFYPPDVEQDPYVWGAIDISSKKDVIVQNVIQKYQQRSEVGIKKYGTTLQDNTDGIETFLTHLQEELMDATLYIEKLKNKFAQLKKEL